MTLDDNTSTTGFVVGATEIHHFSIKNRRNLIGIVHSVVFIQVFISLAVCFLMMILSFSNVPKDLQILQRSSYNMMIVIRILQVAIVSAFLLPVVAQNVTCDLDCQNGFTCQFSYNGANQICSCEIGFAGDLCQFECTKGCVGGACIANVTDQWCQCSPFHEGDLCETERACEKTCLNDGKCEFFEGIRFNNGKYLDECIFHNFGNCPGPEDVQRCTCTRDFVGNDCSQPCPCQNGGTCSTWYNGGNGTQDYYDFEENDEDDAVYFCQCPFGYYGKGTQLRFYATRSFRLT